MLENISGQNGWEAPYDEMDQNIVRLAKALNSFDGIYTVGSCGGHPDAQAYQNPEGTWSILFQLESARLYSPSTAAWLSLEFLVWAFNNNYRRGGWNVNITTYAPPPYLNELGGSIFFTAEGMDVDPDQIAENLMSLKDDLFITRNG